MLLRTELCTAAAYACARSPPKRPATPSPAAARRSMRSARESRSSSHDSMRRAGLSAARMGWILREATTADARLLAGELPVSSDE